MADEYKIKSFDNNNSNFELTTGNNDQIWIMLGIDSGFEGLTRIYLPSIKVQLIE